MLHLLLLLISLLFHLSALAVPHLVQEDVLSSPGTTLNPRQVLIANPAVSCCTSCTSAYSYEIFWLVFNDFCTWAGNGLELWTGQSYATGSYYCQPGDSRCINLLVKYMCGDGSAYSISYAGCLSYFLFTVSPSGTCNGPPYPGAKVVSSDNCWIFQATADTVPNAAKAASSSDLVCDGGRHCDDTAPVAEHTFSSATTASD